MEKDKSSYSGRGRGGRGRRTPSSNITPLGPPPAGHRFVLPQNAADLDERQSQILHHFTRHLIDDRDSDAEDEHHQQEQQHDTQQDQQQDHQHDQHHDEQRDQQQQRPKDGQKNAIGAEYCEPDATATGYSF